MSSRTIAANSTRPDSSKVPDLKGAGRISETICRVSSSPVVGVRGAFFRHSIAMGPFLQPAEAAFSPSSQVRFLKLLQRLEAAGHAQFIMATHSPILLAYPGAQIFSFDSSRIKEVDYEDTEHYRIYKQFFTDRGAFLEG